MHCMLLPEGHEALPTHATRLNCSSRRASRSRSGRCCSDLGSLIEVPLEALLEQRPVVRWGGEPGFNRLKSVPG